MKLKGRLAQEDLKVLGKEHTVSAQRGKIPRVWLLTADSHTARIFRKNEEHLELLGELTPGKEASKHRFTGGGEHTAHHSYRPDKNPGRMAEDIFAHTLAEWLDEAVSADAFDRLVVVAPPHMLGDLRKVMSKQLNARVVAEVGKDFTKHNEAELHKDLAEVLWF